MTTIGREIHGRIAQMNRRLRPAGWELSVERRLGSIESVPREWQDLTVREFLQQNRHLEWLAESLDDSVLSSRVRNLQPDMVMQGPRNQLIVWDLGSRESASHLAKTILYTHLLNGEGLAVIWESFWSASAR